MTTLVPSVLIRSSLILQEMRTTITSRMSSEFGLTGLRTAELAALERLEKTHRLIMRKML